MAESMSRPANDPSNRRRRPNVVVFFTDQQRWDLLGLHGNPLDLTPNLDRLARRGTHVPLACIAQPVCAPTIEPAPARPAGGQLGLAPGTWLRAGTYRRPDHLTRG